MFTVECGISERMIELGHRPWAGYDNPDPADPKTTEAGYLDLFYDAGKGHWRGTGVTTSGAGVGQRVPLTWTRDSM